jgi:S-adenosylmethionine-diacylglycerol 3-amino-3-carboxypropyl transferase
MGNTSSTWVAPAAALPVAFAQVREDPELDSWIVGQLGAAVRVFMIASGGCTAAALAASADVSRLHLVDANPAQLALSRLKLRLLQTATPPQRLALLGHEPMSAGERAARLADELVTLGLPAAALGPPEFVAAAGPDHAGRYECVFVALRESLGARATAELGNGLRLRDPPEQRRRAAPDTELGRRLDEALDAVMALPNLVRLFGAEATNNPVEPFARHFARRIRHALATLPAADNPYLWQMLLGRYPPGAVAPWLAAAPPARMPEVTWEVATMDDALRAAVPASFDFVHLSNILDWLTPEKARLTLDLAWAALRPGGLTLIRQLNSTLDIPALCLRFEWLADDANALHARDRSFFYRALHLGRRR